MVRNYHGFSLVEILVTLVIMGAVFVMGVPRLHDWVAREGARAARLEFTTRLAAARSTAVQRGCQANLHLDDATSHVWVTACKVDGAGIDTIGSVGDLSASHDVTFTSTGSLVSFTPQGIAFGASWMKIAFSKEGYDVPLEISPVGRPVW